MAITFLRIVIPDGILVQSAAPYVGSRPAQVAVGLHPVDILLQAEDDLDGTIYENDLRDLIHSIQDIGCDIRHEIKRVKGIA